MTRDGYGINGPTLPSILSELDLPYVTDAVGGRSQIAHRTGIDLVVDGGMKVW